MLTLSSIHSEFRKKIFSSVTTARLRERHWVNLITQTTGILQKVTALLSSALQKKIAQPFSTQFKVSK